MNISKNIQDYTIREITDETIDYDYRGLYHLWSTIEGFKIRSVDDSKEKITQFIKHNPGLSFVVMNNNGDIIGSSLVGYDGRTAGIYHFCISKEYRKMGLGHSLLEKVLKVLKEKDVSHVELVAFRDNLIGNEFWAHYGFSINETINYYSFTVNPQEYQVIGKV